MHRQNRYAAARFDRLEVRLHRIEKTLEAIRAASHLISTRRRQRKAFSESSADEDKDMRAKSTSATTEGLSSDADKCQFVFGSNPLHSIG